MELYLSLFAEVNYTGTLVWQGGGEDRGGTGEGDGVSVFAVAVPGGVSPAALTSPEGRWTASIIYAAVFEFFFRCRTDRGNYAPLLAV